LVRHPGEGLILDKKKASTLSLSMVLDDDKSVGYKV